MDEIEWIKTDTLQWVKPISESCFSVVNITVRPATFIVASLVIDIDDCADYDLDEEVRGYYDSLDDVKQKYPDNWKQIVAEIICERHDDPLDLISWSTVVDFCNRIGLDPGEAPE